MALFGACGARPDGTAAPSAADSPETAAAIAAATTDSADTGPPAVGVRGGGGPTRAAPRARAAPPPPSAPDAVGGAPGRPDGGSVAAAAPGPRGAVPGRATERTGRAPALPATPAALVPADAVVLDAASALRAWAVADGESRGLVSEPGPIPGRIVVRISAPAARTQEFRAVVEPEGAVTLPPNGIVRVTEGHDTTVLAYVGAAAGPATVVLTPLDAAGAALPPVRVAVVVRPQDDFSDPLLTVVSGRPDATTPGALPSGDSMLCGAAGTDAGVVHVRRSGFRAFATDATDVLIAADDPHGILGPLPVAVSIPAGRSEPGTPLRIALRGAAGRATLRFRTGADERTLVVESVVAKWTAPREVAVAAGETADVVVRLDPATHTAPAAVAAVEGGAATAVVRPPGRSAYPSSVRVAVTGVAPGEATLRLSAPARPPLEVAVHVRAARAASGGESPKPREGTDARR